MSEWDYEPKGGSSDYLKLEDGKTVTIRIVSETYYKRLVTDKQGSIIDTRDFTEDMFDQAEGKGFAVRDRFVWGVWSRDEQAAKVFECGASIYSQLKTLAQDPDWGDPRGYDIKITRTGTGLDTKYAVMPGKNSDPISDEEGNAVLELDIEKMVKGARYLKDVVAERNG